MYGHVITKFSWMGSLPHFFTHGVPLRTSRARAPLKPLNSSKSHRLLDLAPSVKPSVVSVILVFVCGVLLGEE